MTAAHLCFIAFLVASTLLVVALGGDAWLVKENRRLRTALAHAELNAATAVHIASVHVHPSQRDFLTAALADNVDLHVVRGGAS